MNCAGCGPGVAVVLEEWKEGGRGVGSGFEVEGDEGAGGGMREDCCIMGGGGRGEVSGLRVIG